VVVAERSCHSGEQRGGEFFDTTGKKMMGILHLVAALANREKTSYLYEADG
jgi:hypothetical protein